MHLAALLDTFEQTLDNHIAHVVTVAKDSPAGGAGRWESVLSALGLEGIPSAERGRVAAERGHLRGAFPEELEHVLAVLAIQARHTLQIMTHHHQAEVWGDPGLSERVAKLDARLMTLAEAERVNYDKGLRAPVATKGAGVAGIFANVRATAEINPWAQYKWDEQFVLGCPGCGAAQQVELVFTCRYCGANLFQRD